MHLVLVMASRLLESALWGVSPRPWRKTGFPSRPAPIIVVALSGALHGTLINFDVEWIWLLKLHTGNFGLINLQPCRC